MRIKVISGKNSGEVYTVVSLYNKLSSDYNNIHNIRQCRLLGYPGMPGPQGLKGSRGMNGDPGKIENLFFYPRLYYEGMKKVRGSWYYQKHPAGLKFDLVESP